LDNAIYQHTFQTSSFNEKKIKELHKKCLIESGRSLGDEKSTVLLLDVGKTMGKGESKLGSHELLDVRTTNIGILDFSNTDDLNRSETSTVTSSHILVYK
jgi:hypothetical protein